jgi:hypothetical protein
MSQYFPGKDIPEEILFTILKNLLPGAVWLLCRPVSRVWKSHVDANIERYYKEYAKSVSEEEEKYGTEFSEYQGDTVFIYFDWPEMYSRRFIGDGSIPMRFSAIEFPNGDVPRDSNALNWKERVTFKAEHNLLRSTGLSVCRVERRLFPGFRPTEEPDWLELQKENGTFTLEFENYSIVYTVEKRAEDEDDDDDPYWMMNWKNGLPKFNYSVVEASVPIGEFLTFRCPHTVTTHITTSPKYKLPYVVRPASDLLKTGEHGLEPLTEAWEERRAKGYERWKKHSELKSKCPKCLSDLDWWCEKLLCSVCCKKRGFCQCHEAEFRVRRQNILNRLSPHNSQRDKLRQWDLVEHVAYASVFGWEYMILGDLFFSLTEQGEYLPPGLVKEMPERERIKWDYELRRVKSCSSLDVEVLFDSQGNWVDEDDDYADDWEDESEDESNDESDDD